MKYFFKDRPFYNFKEMIEQYDCYLINCRFWVSDIKRIDSLSNDLNDLKIYDTAYRAKREIENQIFTNNNNVDELKRWVNDQLIEIANKIKSLIDDNQLNGANKISDYVRFFDAVQIFWEFYDWFYFLTDPAYSEGSKFENKELTLLDTIEHYLIDFKEKINKNDYQIFVDALIMYFSDGTFPQFDETIKIGKVNIKALGWALNQLYRSQKNEKLSIDYLQFAKKHISTFNKVSFDEENHQKSTLYKYFTTKTEIKNSLNKNH